MTWEINFLRWIVENTHLPFITEFFKYYTLLGEMALIFFIASFIMIGFKQTRKAGLVILFGLVFVAGLNNFALKPLIHRVRPFRSDTLVLGAYVDSFASQSSINALTVPGLTSWSFMSGHTLSAFIFGFTVAIYHRKWAIPALVVSSLMAYSRIYFAFHYPTDIFAGIITAFFTCAALSFLANKYELQIVAKWNATFRKRRVAKKVDSKHEA